MTDNPQNVAVNLTTWARAWKDLSGRLQEDFGLDPDDEALLDTLAGESSLPEKVALVLQAARQAVGFADAIDKIIDENEARKARFERRAEKLRNAVLAALIEAGEKRMELPGMTAVVAHGAPELLLEVLKLPEAFFRQPPPVVKRAEVRAALNRGEIVPGAMLGNAAPHLVVKTR
jgi:Siphovirus Gp157